MPALYYNGTYCKIVNILVEFPVLPTKISLAIVRDMMGE